MADSSNETFPLPTDKPPGGVDGLGHRGGFFESAIEILKKGHGGLVVHWPECRENLAGPGDAKARAQAAIAIRLKQLAASK